MQGPTHTQGPTSHLRPNPSLQTASHPSQLLKGSAYGAGNATDLLACHPMMALAVRLVTPHMPHRQSCWPVARHPIIMAQGAWSLHTCPTDEAAGPPPHHHGAGRLVTPHMPRQHPTAPLPPWYLTGPGHGAARSPQDLRGCAPSRRQVLHPVLHGGIQGRHRARAARRPPSGQQIGTVLPVAPSQGRR